MQHFDWDGQPMSRDAWADTEYPSVAVHWVGDTIVSTVWTGSDYRTEPVGPPAVFETLVFHGPLDDEKEWTADARQARAAHDRMVARVEQAQGERARPVDLT